MKESNIRDSYWECTEVNDFDTKNLLAGGVVFRQLWGDLEPNPADIESVPCVDDAKHSTENGD